MSDQLELMESEKDLNEKETVEENGKISKDATDAAANGNNNSLSQFLNRMGILETESEIQQAPQLSYFELFKRFLWFGARAFGGPFAQIQMMKQELVIDEKWVDLDRFIRVFAVYQALPGPEVIVLLLMIFSHSQPAHPGHRTCLLLWLSLTWKNWFHYRWFRFCSPWLSGDALLVISLRQVWSGKQTCPCLFPHCSDHDLCHGLPCCFQTW
jgi:hypothetical protein